MSEDFYNEFDSYEGCVPAGVRLPEITIDEKHYIENGIDLKVDNFEFLEKMCLKGIEVKNINSKDNYNSYISRLSEELKILNSLGFIDYILLNWDVINFCHENKIPTGPGRGSAAGSLVLFLIGVTDVDPIKYDLFFERFVSKSRAKKIIEDGITYLDGSLLADVDNDIAYEYRQTVINYIERKHPNRTSKILTLNTLSGKLCIKECGKLVGSLSEQEVNLISDSIPKNFGIVMKLSEAKGASEKFSEFCDKNESIYKISLKLEGLNKNTGVHPSGIAISHKPIAEICPTQRTSEGALVSCYDMNDVAELMVKFDILGLRTLTAIHKTAKMVGISPANIDLDSEEIYKNLSNLRTPHGLFQIEADANYMVCKKINLKI